MSSSSEFAESGTFPGQWQARAPERSSNFTQTCSLLSQYLKENGTFGDLSLGMTCGLEGNGMPMATTTAAPAATTMSLFPMAKKSGEVSGVLARNAAPMSRNLTSMDLFPQQSGFGSNVSKEEVSSVNKSEPETAQMTIFYAGQVIVFNDFPAEDAKEVMLLASKGSSHNLSTFASTPVQNPVEPTSSIPTSSSPLVPNFANKMMQENAQRPPQPTATDLPLIKRKASLTRFLEKRKDRVTARAPYHTSYSAASPPKPAESKTWLGLAAQSPAQFEHQL